jgi:hypothetical protein
MLIPFLGGKLHAAAEAEGVEVALQGADIIERDIRFADFATISPVMP